MPVFNRLHRSLATAVGELQKSACISCASVVNSVLLSTLHKQQVVKPKIQGGCWQAAIVAGGSTHLRLRTMVAGMAVAEVKRRNRRTLTARVSADKSGEIVANSCCKKLFRKYNQEQLLWTLPTGWDLNAAQLDSGQRRH